MTWFKVDDGFWSHPKTATLSDAAVTLWVRAGAYCCQHLTDGFVKKAQLRLLGESEAAEELSDAGLWHLVDGGWVFHDWDEYQETSTIVKKRREEARERQRRSREAREEQRRLSQRESQCDSGVTDSVSDDVSSSESHCVSSQPPTRPDPTRPPTAKAVGESAPKRATRLPADWMPSEATIATMKDECPGIHLQTEHRKFLDYWVAKSGKDATKLDWDATWRNWIRRAAENPRATNGHKVPASDAAVAAVEALMHSTEFRLELE